MTTTSLRLLFPGSSVTERGLLPVFTSLSEKPTKVMTSVLPAGASIEKLPSASVVTVFCEFFKEIVAPLRGSRLEESTFPVNFCWAAAGSVSARQKKDHIRQLSNRLFILINGILVVKNFGQQIKARHFIASLS